MQLAASGCTFERKHYDHDDNCRRSLRISRGFVGGLIISAPSEPTIKPISPDWGLLNEKQHLEYRLAVTEKENIRLREENYRFRMMTHAWNHCCPHCYTQHTRVVYAKSPKEQEIVDLLKKTSVPLDELKEKFGIK